MSERIRFEADEDFNSLIVKQLLKREPLIDFQTTAQAGLQGFPDLVLLARAAEQGRILVSHDLKTMPIHFSAFLASGQHSPGVFLLDQGVPIGTAIEALYLVWEASTPEEWQDQIIHLPL
ncbi:MAG TPA: DUF5615 family PIN-like protein [Ktedonobacterales bacterium]|jgi:hypothetical protein